MKKNLIKPLLIIILIINSTAAASTRIVNEEPEDFCEFIVQKHCDSSNRIKNCFAWHETQAARLKADTIKIIQAHNNTQTNVFLGMITTNTVVVADYYRCEKVIDDFALATEAKSNPKRTVEERLITLKQLLDDRLIDEETFREQQKILLEDL